MAALDIRRADDRPLTRNRWLHSRHSFSFAAHYNPSNTHHGLLLVNNDDVVAPGRGSTPIPTGIWRSSPGCSKDRWCIRTPPGTPGVIYPGWPSGCRPGAESCIRRRTTRGPSAAKDTAIRCISSRWVVPDEEGRTRGYQQLEIDHELLSGGLVTIASGMPAHRDASAITIGNRYAALHGARLAPVTVSNCPTLRISMCSVPGAS